MLITVFTPTYNRKELLERLFLSLQKQTVNNFEWMIVDDGSTDNTREYIKKISTIAKFNILYIYKENGGKPSAHNEALKNCNTEFILIVDSDDILVDDAIEVLNAKCNIIRSKDNTSGIIGNKGYIGDNSKVIGTKIPNVEYASGLELYQRFNFKGETLRLYKTEVLKKYPFPIIKNEKFIPENVVFDKIDQHYKMLVINEVLYLCEYQENGLSNNISNVRKRNPIGYSLSLKSSAETALTIKKKFGLTILYILWCRIFHLPNSFRTFNNKFVYVICLPVSFIFQIFKIPKFFFNMFKEINNDES